MRINNKRLGKERCGTSVQDTHATTAGFSEMKCSKTMEYLLYVLVDPTHRCHKSCAYLSFKVKLQKRENFVLCVPKRSVYFSVVAITRWQPNNSVHGGHSSTLFDVVK